MTNADHQRDAIAEARRLCAAADEPGTVHVYGAKLFGALAADEAQCSTAQPFTGSGARVVYHLNVLARGWSGDHFCVACGTGSQPEDEQ